jgi:Tripartite tricarboxylate transporter TctB family
MKIKAPQDFWAGLMFLGFGLGFAWAAQNYQMGTSVRMGPAYFPTVLGGILAILGLSIFLKSFVAAGPKVSRFYMKPLILVLGGVIIFALLLRPLGLMIATAALILVSALGGSEFRLKEVIIEIVCLVVFALVIFVKGLGLPFTLCPGSLDETCQRIVAGGR